MEEIYKYKDGYVYSGYGSLMTQVSVLYDKVGSVVLKHGKEESVMRYYETCRKSLSPLTYNTYAVLTVSLDDRPEEVVKWLNEVLGCSGSIVKRLPDLAQLLQAELPEGVV